MLSPPLPHRRRCHRRHCHSHRCNRRRHQHRRHHRRRRRRRHRRSRSRCSVTAVVVTAALSRYRCPTLAGVTAAPPSPARQLSITFAAAIATTIFADPFRWAWPIHYDRNPPLVTAVTTTTPHPKVRPIPLARARKSTGYVEAHTNGFRYLSKRAGEKPIGAPLLYPSLSRCLSSRKRGVHFLRTQIAGENAA